MNDMLWDPNEWNGFEHRLIERQSPDGAWRFCFESGTLTEAFLIITVRCLGMNNQDGNIARWCRRLLSCQQSSGAWKLYADEEEGNLAASVECYYALLFSGLYKPTDEPLTRAHAYILSRGGLASVNSLLTKVLLAVTGSYPWPRLQIPVELLLIPDEAPVSFYDFVGFSRVHMAPVLVLADRRFVLSTPWTPDISSLHPNREGTVSPPEAPQMRSGSFLQQVQEQLAKLASFPEQLHRKALHEAERFMLSRIESDGTLYSYASATFLMIYALRALDYAPDHPVILRAVEGLLSLACPCEDDPHIQNSTSTVWDTALLSGALQEAGVSPEHPSLARASDYLLSRQQHKLGDWYLRNANAYSGGWGFSDINTINPDIDDTSAALRALSRLRHKEPFREAWNRGLHWLISMQNDDGGWPAFEKNTDLSLLTWLPLPNAADATIDPSSADLTGRTLEFLGSYADLTIKLPFISKAVDWLLSHQEGNGSWYGRWGVCYLYGTWAAVTGMCAVGVPSEQRAVGKAVSWLLEQQLPDGSWGESCRSDVVRKYVPLGFGTPSQTAWALDALVAAHERPTPELVKGLKALLRFIKEGKEASPEAWAYPTGAGLPGLFYTRYHSYNYIWPLLAVAHYRRKFG